MWQDAQGASCLQPWEDSPPPQMFQIPRNRMHATRQNSILSIYTKSNSMTAMRMFSHFGSACWATGEVDCHRLMTLCGCITVLSRCKSERHHIKLYEGTKAIKHILPILIPPMGIQVGVTDFPILFYSILSPPPSFFLCLPLCPQNSIRTEPSTHFFSQKMQFLLPWNFFILGA